MKTKTFITALLSISLAFISCRNDDNPEPQPVEKQTYLSKTITGTSITTYQYDQNNRVISSLVEYNSSPASNVTNNYIYDSSGNLIEWNFNIPGTTNQAKIIYTYNSGGKIAQIKNYTDYGSTETLDRTITPVYETATKISVMALNSGDLTAFKEYDVLLDDKGNLIQRIRYSGLGSIIYTDQYGNFDDKHSPSQSIPKTSYTSSPNNFMKLVSTDGSGASTTTTYAIEYDSDGYPTKRTSSAGAVVQYEYIKK